MSGRRGFTVLETMLAAAMGSLVLVAVVVLLGMVDRTERLTSRRERDTATLAQLHMVMDRTFGSLVMMDGVTLSVPQPGDRSGKDGPPPARPRMLLEPVGSRNSARPPASDLPAQRLEVVVEKSPVPPGWGGGPLMDTSYAMDDPDVVATRGVFEVRPGRGRDRAADGTWTLWWRPLPPHDDGREALAFRLEPGQDERAVVVADGLTECQWLAFKNRQRGSEIAASKFDELPAYMEMQVATVSGITANWMFEVQWSNGPETGAEAELIAAARAQGAGPGATGATGATGSTGAPGGPAPAVTPAVPPGVVKPGAAHPVVDSDLGQQGARPPKRKGAGPR
jgi:hypothetical protein